MTEGLVRIRNSSGEEVFVLKEKFVVVNFGRDKRSCHVAFDPQAARVSRVHASIERTDEGIVFTDKSKEGTVIGQEKVKQSSKVLEIGLHNIQIGGIPVTVEIEGEELDETVPDSPSSIQEAPIPENDVTENIQSTVREEPDEVASVYTLGFTRERYDRKRKSEVSLFEEESQPRRKRGPIAKKSVTVNFDEEVENCVKKGPRARRAEDIEIVNNENPPKKMKPAWEPVPSQSQRSITNFFRKENTTSPDADAEICAIVDQVAAMPSMSATSSKKKEELAMDLEIEMHLDRGPAAPNETIKYVNLIFHQPDLNKSHTTTMIDPNIPNFKRFKPKNQQDGRTSAVSMYSNMTTTSHTTISLVDARRIH
uniref:FHA domain-containing protein n=1 Tax=Caenorhabditis japonica TaxID=281687 RepID=A0A8R1I1Z5_CAEJA